MRPPALLPLLLAVALAAPARAMEPAGTAIVPAGRLAGLVRLEAVRHDRDTVSGTIVNASDDPIRDVRLLVADDWLWRDEMHPGDDGPGRATFFTLDREIPPGGRASFVHRRARPLPERPDGHFATSVSVVGCVTIGRR